MTVDKSEHRGARSAWGRHYAEALAQDTRHAIRGLVNRPTFTIVVVFTLALGLGVNAAVFSLLDRLFARPPAGVSSPAELHRIYFTRTWSSGDRSIYAALDWPAWTDLRAAASAGGVASTGYGLDSVRLGDDAHARRIVASYIDPDYWRVLGTHVAVGRSFTADESRIDAPTNLVIVGDAFWRRELGARPEVVGTTLQLGTLKYQIIGVAPRGFTGVDLDDAELWLPVGAMPMPHFSEKPWYQIRTTGMIHGVVRVPGGVDLRPLEARLTAAYKPGAVAYGYRNDTAAVISTGSILAALGPMEPDRAVQLSTRLAFVSMLVLLIACANVANLLLARAVQRRREIAVRLALGISRRRLAAQTMIESALLALGAAIGAMFAGAWTGVALRRMLMPKIHWRDTLLDWRVMALTAVVALVAAFATGLAPLTQARRLDLTDALKAGRDTAVRGRRLRTALVIAQTALAVVLLAGAGLFVRSLRRVLDVDLGYDVDRIVHAEPMLVDARGGIDETHRIQVGDDLAEVARRLAANPNLDGVALAYWGPLGGYGMTGVVIPGIDSTPKLNGDTPTINMVSPEYVTVTGMKLLRGRPLTSRDVEGAPPVMLINQTMARTIWPGADPIGRCVEPYGRRGLCYTVVGIVTDAHRSRVVEPPVMQFYLSLAQGTTKGAAAHASSIVVRARGERVGAAVTAIERTMREVMPNAVPNVMPLRGSLQEQFSTWRTGATLFSALGILALVVAALGVYGVIAYDVGQRTHEMGIRIALGARRVGVIQLVVGKGVQTVALGLMVGLGLALVAGKLVATLLYDTSPRDPGVLAGVAIVLLVVAVLASFVPAWRAAAVDPATALRAE
jgi:predicted permease